jgi:hypothetical protein
MQALPGEEKNTALVQLRALNSDRQTKSKQKVKKEKREMTGLDWSVAKLQKACTERGMRLGPSSFTFQ